MHQSGAAHTSATHHDDLRLRSHGGWLTI
jgi:hypothetical protein